MTTAGDRAHHPAKPTPDSSGFGPTSVLDPFPEDASSKPYETPGRARWLVVFVCLALLTTNGWLVVNARQDTIAQAEANNSNLARAMMERVEATVSEADHILDSLVYTLEQANISPPALEQLQPILVNHVARTGQLQGLFVFGADGDWLATSEPNWSAAWNVAERASFVQHRDNPSARSLVGPPVQSQPNGDWVLPVSRRLNDADGHFAGVVLAALSIPHLHRLLAPFEMGDGAILLTASGRLVARDPPLPSDIGKLVLRMPVDEQPNRQAAGTSLARSPLDGVERLSSYVRGRDYPLRINVSRSASQVLANWRVQSAWQTAWVVFLCLMLALAERYTRRTLRQRHQVEGRLRQARDALRHANERLGKLAQFDELTRLANRRYFDRRLARVLRNAQRKNCPLAVVMVDVDDFKKYNDHYGHVEGDECLRRVAAALRASIKRPEDFAARYGGEEMVLLLPDTDVLGATLVAETARVAVASMDIAHAGAVSGKVTISLGVAAWVPGPTDAPASLLKAADAALYQAKRGGRNCVMVHSTADA
jgi:diguanylate cyclase (GGDEF)-like protein